MDTHPLVNQVHYDALRKAQRELSDILAEIERAEACGVDCTDYRQGREYLQGKVNAFLDQYFPNGPPQTQPFHVHE